MAARQYVPPPAFTPLPFGLLSSLGPEIRSPSGTHWRLGVTYEPLCGVGGATTYDECFSVTGTGLDPAGPPPPKNVTGGLDRRGATAFTVYSEVDCSAPGFWDRAVEVVGEFLTRSEQWQVERAFWTGEAAGQPVVYPHLAADTEVVDPLDNVTLQTAADVIPGGPHSLLGGLGLLEQAVANCYDGVAVLHMPRSVGAALATHGVLTREGPRYRTTTGNIVVFGAGYPGTSPSGVTPPTGTTWIYATGAMFVYRSRPVVHKVEEMFDRANNTVRAIAERTYVLGWDCCHHAVEVNFGNLGE